jgi:hypothetical protein
LREARSVGRNLMQTLGDWWFPDSPGLDPTQQGASPPENEAALFEP